MSERHVSISDKSSASKVFRILVYKTQLFWAALELNKLARWVTPMFVLACFGSLLYVEKIKGLQEPYRTLIESIDKLGLICGFTVVSILYLIVAGLFWL